MIYKRCARCRKRIPSGTTCECYKRTDEKRMYAKAEGIKKEYHTQRWKDLRRVVMHAHNNIDIYLLYKYSRIVPADTVHHIETTSKRPDLFYSYDNLIPVSRAGHNEIHERYKTGDIKAVKDELRGYLKRYKATGGM